MNWVLYWKRWRPSVDNGCGLNFPHLELIPDVLGGCTFYKGHYVDFYFTDVEGTVDQESFFLMCHNTVSDYRATGRNIPCCIFNYEFGSILIILHHEIMVMLLLKKSANIDYVVTGIRDTLKTNDEFLAS